MLGDDHIHVVDLESFTSEIKSWTIFNEEGEEEIFVPNKWRPQWKSLPSIPGLAIGKDAINKISNSKVSFWKKKQ